MTAGADYNASLIAENRMLRELYAKACKENRRLRASKHAQNALNLQAYSDRRVRSARSAGFSVGFLLGCIVSCTAFVLILLRVYVW